MAREIPVTQARAELAELVNRVGYGGERVVLTRHGRPLAALVPAADLEVLEPATGEVISATSSVRTGAADSRPEERRPFQIAAEHRPAGPPPAPASPPSPPGWRSPR